MFDYGKFIIDNLKSGFENGSFTAEQVNIFAVNYKLKALITDEQFNEIIEFVKPVEEVTEEVIEEVESEEF